MTAITDTGERKYLLSEGYFIGGVTTLLLSGFSVHLAGAWVVFCIVMWLVRMVRVNGSTREASDG